MGLPREFSEWLVANAAFQPKSSPRCFRSRAVPGIRVRLPRQACAPGQIRPGSVSRSRFTFMMFLEFCPHLLYNRLDDPDPFQQLFAT